MADRVPRGLVPRDDEQDKEGSEFASAHRAVFRIRIQQLRRQIVARVLRAIRCNLIHERSEFATRTKSRRNHLRRVRDEIGIAQAKDDVGISKDHLSLAIGDPHHVADNFQGKRRRDVSHEVAFAALDHTVNDYVCAALDGVFQTAQGLRREPSGDDAAETTVARVVHIDHAAKELRKFRGQIRDRRRASRRRMNRRISTRLKHVCVARERPIPGSCRNRRIRHHLLFLIPMNGTLLAQRRESAFALLDRPHPEVTGGELDLING